MTQSKTVSDYSRQNQFVGGSHFSPELSVIVPCLNEEKNITKALSLLKGYLKEISYEIIVVDDLSDDKTVSTALNWKNSNPNVDLCIIKRDLSRRGYGAVVKYGLAHARGSYVTVYAADCVDPGHLLPMMYSMMTSYDLVQVSRYNIRKNSVSIPFKYRFYQYFYRIFVHIALGMKVADSTYAFKMFKRTHILGLGLSSNRFSISPEIYFKATLAGYSIGIIDGAQTHREEGISKFVFRREAFGFIYCLLRTFLHRKKIVFWF